LVAFDGVEGLVGSSSIVTPTERSSEFVRTPCPVGKKEPHMFATIRRYDGVDQNRSAELTRRVNETLVPKLEKLSGFAGYWLIQEDNVFSSLSLFETPEQCKESTTIVASWIRDEKLETMIPNEPKITTGKVVAHSDRVLVAA
jgi:hypothetical protein